MTQIMRYIVRFINGCRGYMARNPWLQAVCIIGLAARMCCLGSKSFWFDEALVLLESKNPLFEILSPRAEGIHPPLYRLIMHFWLFLGSGEWILRIPSLIFSFLCVCLAYRIGRLLFDRSAALLGAFLMSISPFQVYYSQEAKMYSLLLFFSLLSSYFFLRLLREDRKDSWVWYIGANLGCLYTHYFAFFSLFAHGIYLIYFCFRRKNGGLLTRWLAAQCCGVLFFSPWMKTFLSHAAKVKENFWVPVLSPGEVGSVVKNLILGYYTGDIPFLLAYCFFPLFFILGLFSPVSGRDSSSGEWLTRQEKIFFLIISVVIPLASSLVISIVFRPVFLSRTLIAVSAWYCLGAAAGISALRGKKILRYGVVIIAVALMSAGLRNYYLNQHFRPSIGVVKKRAMRPLAQFIVSHFQRGDVVALAHSSLSTPFLYYCPGYVRENLYLIENAADDPGDQSTLLALRGTFGMRVRDLREIVRGKRGLWVVFSGYDTEIVPLPPALEKWLGDKRLIFDNTSFEGLEARYYTLGGVR